MKVAVIGCRHFRDYDQVYADLDRARAKWGDFTVVSGGASGADSIAALWAKSRGLPMEIYYPVYQRYGRRAPLERNHTIVAVCDRVIAFWDEKSTGTAHTLGLARLAGKPVYLRLIP